MTTPGISQSAHYITFKLGDELFAVDVARVREVLDLSPITHVPTAPSYMRGVVNVRGSAIPVVDLRLKFSLPSIPDTVHTRIVVLELEIEGESTVLGGLADSVHEVLEIDPSEVGEPPRIAMRWRSEVIRGLAKKDGRFIILLDIARVFASDASTLLQSASMPPPAPSQASPSSLDADGP